MINFGVTERKSQELDRRKHNCNLLENDIEEPTGNKGVRYFFGRSTKEFGRVQQSWINIEEPTKSTIITNP